jgi:alpha/beta superfamily hydrolase
MRPLANAGFDVYVFDYIHLTGPFPLPRLEELILDARTLVQAYLQDSRYAKAHNVLYGASTGGVILAQAIKRKMSASTRVVLDSVPDKIPRLLFCDDALNPIEAIEEMSPGPGQLLILNGRNDQKVVPANSRNIAEAALRKSGCHVVLAKGSHPFESDDVKSERIDAISLHAISGCQK